MKSDVRCHDCRLLLPSTTILQLGMKLCRMALTSPARLADSENGDKKMSRQAVCLPRRIGEEKLFKW